MLKTDVGSFIEDGVGKADIRNGQVLCRIPNCSDCDKLPESTTIHLDCFVLFKRNYVSSDALDRLWLAAALRYPWRQAPLLGLSTSIAIIPPMAVRRAAEMLGLAKLKALPLEFWQIIRSYSESHLFWRYVSVLDFARHVASLPPDPPKSIGVDQIANWHRGAPPQLLETNAVVHPILRLAIDPFGIRSIERLAAYPRGEEEQFDDMAFVVEDISKFSGATALYKVQYLPIMAMPLH